MSRGCSTRWWSRLRQLGRHAEAHRVALYVLNLPAEDASTPDFRVWAAFEEALQAASGPGG